MCNKLKIVINSRFMKKIKVYFSIPILTIALIFTSCEKLLEENEKGVYSADTFYNSEDDAISAILAVYVQHKRIEYAQRFQFNLMDLPTDECNTYGKSAETLFSSWDVDASTEEFTYFFKYIYLCINRANSVIENVSKMSTTLISETARDQIVGEAYFLRAFHHLMAVRTFGEIPIHNEMVTSASQGNIAYSSIQEVYEFIISDLEKAVSMMAIDRNLGRADLAAAQATLAKVYLVLASSKMTGAPGYDWVSDYEAMYEKAAEYADMVISDQTTYSLDPNLSEVYNVDHEDSPENIWISHGSRTYDTSNFPMMFSNSIEGKYIPRILGKTVNSSSDVELYISEEQSGWSYYRPDSTFYSSYDEDDLRRELLLTTIYDVNGNVVVKWSPNNINSSDAAEAAFYFPMCRKYTDPYSNGIYTSAELYFIRYAEVLLTYAEAVGPTERGYEAINSVRNRANLPDLQPGLSTEEFREKVWEELKFELAFEGHNLLELRRTNRVETITKSEAILSKINEYGYFYPIPQRELDLNTAN